MKVATLYSGGKDSTYAAYLASKRDELACLITVFPESDESYMFHFPNLRWTALQAEAAGVPQWVGRTAGVKEEELSDLEAVMRSAKERFALEGVYTGALASVYQKSRVEKICSGLRLECVSPFWGADPEQHLRSLLREGFVAQVVSVSALGLDESWLGRTLDEKAVDELVALGAKYRFHIGLEGGEGETFVLDCPLFSKRIEVVSSQKHWRGDSGYLEIKEARAVPKLTRTGWAA
ncbi:MAG TPA: diphthine--ammonia ligase [Nitrososphaerales archaeon]|nr:diphthine--ammonia ligase [Nitrososphaerales archaeon]